MKPTHAGRSERGFSLLELVLVVAIIGVLAATAALRVSHFNETASVNTAMAQFAALEKAVQMYNAEYGALPPDVGLGIFPIELEPYLDPSSFDMKPALGQIWDWNPTWGPIQPNFGMHAVPQPIALWTAFDAKYDDGNLNSGDVQIAGNGKQLLWKMHP